MTNQERLDRILTDLSADYQRLNGTQQAFAIKELGRVRLDIADLLTEFSDSDGSIKRQRLARLQRELITVEKSLRQYGTATFDEIIRETAGFTTAEHFAAYTAVTGAVMEASVERINSEVVNYVARRFGADDLVLSDRVWNLAGDQLAQITNVIRTGIIRGDSVTGMIAAVRQVQENDTWKIRRLVRTEGNMAYRTASIYSARRSEVVIAKRMHRGKADLPNHRCTELELEDRYGMGAGVYTFDDPEIYNPHVNCTGYLTDVLNPKYL